MCQNFETCYSTLSNIRAYGQKCQNFYAYFIQFSSFLPTHLSSDNNFRVSWGTLQPLDSTTVLSSDHFKLHFNTALVPSVVERLPTIPRVWWISHLRCRPALPRFVGRDLPAPMPPCGSSVRWAPWVWWISHLQRFWVLWFGMGLMGHPLRRITPTRVGVDAFGFFFFNDILMWCIYYFNVWDWKIEHLINEIL